MFGIELIWYVWKQELKIFLLVLAIGRFYLPKSEVHDTGIFFSLEFRNFHMV